MPHKSTSKDEKQTVVKIGRGVLPAIDKFLQTKRAKELGCKYRSDVTTKAVTDWLQREDSSLQLTEVVWQSYNKKKAYWQSRGIFTLDEFTAAILDSFEQLAKLKHSSRSR
jgi:hypothetical protein